jgi:hypothetical protein
MRETKGVPVGRGMDGCCKAVLKTISYVRKEKIQRR